MRASLRLAVLAVLLGAVPLRAQADDLDQLLAKATWYSIDFINHLSSVVAEERYIQDSNVALATVAIPALGGRGGAGMNVPRGSSKHRELRADFLIVKSGNDMWTPFRDVFEVDHIPIRDREERLAKLFLSAKPNAGAEEQASGWRSDLGGGGRLEAANQLDDRVPFSQAEAQPGRSNRQAPIDVNQREMVSRNVQPSTVDFT